MLGGFYRPQLRFANGIQSPRPLAALISASFSVVLDTIRVTVEAFATGRVKFNEVPEKTNKTHIRIAPSFLTGACSGGPPEHAYTASTIGDFLGWLDSDGNASTRLRHGLNARELIELDCMQASNFDGLGKEVGRSWNCLAGATITVAACDREAASKPTVESKKTNDLGEGAQNAHSTEKTKGQRWMVSRSSP